MVVADGGAGVGISGDVGCGADGSYGLASADVVVFGVWYLI